MVIGPVCGVTDPRLAVTCLLPDQHDGPHEWTRDELVSWLYPDGLL